MYIYIYIAKERERERVRMSAIDYFNSLTSSRQQNRYKLTVTLRLLQLLFNWHLMTTLGITGRLAAAKATTTTTINKAKR